MTYYPHSCSTFVCPFEIQCEFEYGYVICSYKYVNASKQCKIARYSLPNVNVSEVERDIQM